MPGPLTRARARELAVRVTLGLAAGALFALLAFPLAGLLFSAPPGELLRGLRDPAVGPAAALSVGTTAVSLAFIVAGGTPLAWVLARNAGPRWRALETVVELPAVLPPAVAGVALLLVFGRRGLLGPALSALGIGLPFTAAAVVAAQSFVAAPFYVQAATAAFRRLDRDLVLVARTLGASPVRVFLTVAIPIARPALAGGAALAWARALGEFGATLMFAGNMPGRTQTLPLAIYSALESDLRTAQGLSILLVAAAFALLVAVVPGGGRDRAAGRSGGDGRDALGARGVPGRRSTHRADGAERRRQDVGAVDGVRGPASRAGPPGAERSGPLRRGIEHRPADRAAGHRLPAATVRAVSAPRRAGQRRVRHRWPTDERLARAREALAELEAEALAARRPDQLSGGEAQRVALARAFAARPRALLLDEPLAALDPSVRRNTRRFLADRLRGWSLPTVVVTHDPADAEALNGEVLVLEAGAIVSGARRP